MKHVLLLVALVSALSATAQTITEYRWWINDDVSTITTTAAGPNADLTLIADLDLPFLSKDYNTITLQFRDSDGRYGAPYTMPFARGTGAVNGYEWWIDDAVSSRISGTIGPDDVVDLVADLPTGVTNGEHLFTIRFSGASGTWSVPLTTAFSFFTRVEELPGVSDLLLFPNPTNGELTVRLTSADGEQLRMTVLDATGRIVRSVENWAPTGTAVHVWDVADLAPGSYGLRITRGDRQSVVPFQKN